MQVCRQRTKGAVHKKTIQTNKQTINSGLLYWYDTSDSPSSGSDGHKGGEKNKVGGVGEEHTILVSEMCLIDLGGSKNEATSHHLAMPKQHALTVLSDSDFLADDCPQKSRTARRSGPSNRKGHRLSCNNIVLSGQGQQWQCA